MSSDSNANQVRRRQAGQTIVQQGNGLIRKIGGYFATGCRTVVAHYREYGIESRKERIIGRIAVEVVEEIDIKNPKHFDGNLVVMNQLYDTVKEVIQSSEFSEELRAMIGEKDLTRRDERALIKIVAGKLVLEYLKQTVARRELLKALNDALDEFLALAASGKGNTSI